MKYLTPKKVLSFHWDKTITDRECETITNNIMRAVPPKNDLEVEVHENRRVSVRANELQDIIDIFEECKVFSFKKRMEFEAIFVVEMLLEFEGDEEAEEFIGNYLKIPECDTTSWGLELKFICNQDTDPLFIHMTRYEDKMVMIRSMDLSDDEMDFGKMYDYIISSINKIIRL